MKTAIAVLGLLLAAEADPFAGVRFLVGEWTAGTSAGTPGQATSGGFSFAPELGGKVLVRRNVADYPPRPGEKEGTHHEDLMVVYSTPGGLKATYWDNEGHVIPYSVSTASGTATFESEETKDAPRFKLVYEQKGAELAVSFSIAPPGQPYKSYLTATVRRK
jgi:hypothetical protein